MEWLRTLNWVLRDKGRGAVFMPALVTGVCVFVPMQAPSHGMDQVSAGQGLDR